MRTGVIQVRSDEPREAWATVSSAVDEPDDFTAIAIYVSVPLGVLCVALFGWAALLRYRASHEQVSRAESDFVLGALPSSRGSAGQFVNPAYGQPASTRPDHYYPDEGLYGADLAVVANATAGPSHESAGGNPGREGLARAPSIDSLNNSVDSLNNDPTDDPPPLYVGPESVTFDGHTGSEANYAE